ncbi:hypothetical protein VaNZ11_003671 [Volvox africanus]|uniref:peptidylprolyl isomerase n=1 Tax=Volvox africanus TaxID=51714 RepID=A0ABQ5RUM2_9CHLO|nr:hypothetical protein VaNZ11_003671 [Volvox africanus]
MKLDDFQRYLAELRTLPSEVPLEPELKAQRVKLDKRIREEQALAAGAVLTAVLDNGDSEASPREGDMVYIHYSIRNLEDELLYSTRSDEGGSGQAFAFLMEKGVRVPRGWELAVRDMTRGQRTLLQVKPEFGFRHPDCRMTPPVRDLPQDQPLRYDITLLHWYPAASVHVYGAGEALYKRCIREAAAWESPRPPFEVTLHLSVRCPAYDGMHLTGQCLFTTAGRQPLTLQLGRGLLPPAVEEALSYMSKGEVAAYVVPARRMLPGEGGDGTQGGASSSSDDEDDDVLGVASFSATSKSRGGSRGRGGGQESVGQPGVTTASPCLVPPPPARCTQVELEIELLSMVQVRDLTGTGEVTKKRLQEGQGEFPIDCPLHDTAVRLHFKARPLRPLQPPQGLADELPAVPVGASGAGADAMAESPIADGGEEAWTYDSRDAHGEPLSADTGCGELPEGLEMALKLMVPGEVSRVVAAPRFAYLGREDRPPGIPGDATVEFEVELLDFEREGHWQNLSFEERYVLAERLKSKGNELFRKGQHKYARARYERLLRLLESTRDFETQEEVDRIDGYKVAVLGNLALVCTQLEEYMAAVAACDKGLQYEQENAKLHFRKGKAQSLFGDYEYAAETLKLALEYDSSIEKEINAELAANTERQKAALRKQKRDMGNFFKTKR